MFLSIDGQTGDMKISKNLHISDEFKVGMSGTFSINGVSQWQMVHEEVGSSFDLSNWDLPKSGDLLATTKCGGYDMLGGYGKLSVHKLRTTVSLAGYNYDMIKIEARFHFIDAWSG